MFLWRHKVEKKKDPLLGAYRYVVEVLVSDSECCDGFSGTAVVAFSDTRIKRPIVVFNILE
jgi:hypothetical protein